MMQPTNANRDDKIIVQIDAEFEELIPKFLDNRHKDVALMVAALDHGDYERIRLLGHSMKGTGAGFGFEAIGEIGAQIEQAAKDGDAEQIRRSVNVLSAYLERVEVVFE